MFGLVWVTWFGAIAIWPRKAIERSRRWTRWRREGFGPWAGWPAEAPRKPRETADWLVTLYRWVGVAGAGFGAWIIAGGVARS